MPTPRQERSRVAGLTRFRGAEHPDTLVAKHDLRVAKLKKHIQQVVDQAPPLTREQRDRLSLLLQQSPGTEK